MARDHDLLTTEPAEDSAVRLRGLTRRFGTRTVLDNIDLDIPPGQFVALLGRSGSGKSTLLRALAGLDDGACGRIEAPRQKSVAFQDSRILPWQPVLANVRLGLYTDNAAEHAAEVLAEVGLAGREESWPKELSGGEQQRVSLARALAREPKLFLADEPFGSLDALTKVKMHGLLRKLLERRQPTVLLVTHDIDEAIQLADRILVLDGGRVTIDQSISAPHPRTITHPALVELREELLSALGVAVVA